MIHWHTLSTEQTFRELGADSGGLRSEQVEERLRRYGPNEIAVQGRKSAGRILLAQFNNFMIMILVATAIISGVIGDLTDTLVILLIVVLNAALGFLQEYRAERAIEALKKMSALSARVMRNGKIATIEASRLVPGDIVLLEAGNVVPADSRLIEAGRLKTGEASLTGESNPVEKQLSPVEIKDLPLGDRTNMVYKGTSVVYGRGKGIVVATGLTTELGKIALMLQEGDTKTPLQKRLAVFSKHLAYGILIICVTVFVVGLFQEKEPVLMLLTAMSLAVAAIPEALPAVITISLALGVARMIRQHVLVRKLPSVETLGSVTYICTDKTGTLTLNKMKVVEVAGQGKVFKAADFSLLEGGAAFSDLLSAMALNCDVIESKKGGHLGDPTELALFEMALERGFEKTRLEKTFPRVAEIPFDSDRKCMTTIHRNGNGYLVLSKGAPEVMLEKKRVRQLDSFYDEITDKMTAEGLRVITYCKRELDELPDTISEELIENDWEVVGVAGIMDPPREEVMDAIEQCRNAGIVPVLITGDHANTARAIARKLGILETETDKLMTGRQLEEISELDFEAEVKLVKVYARVSPEQKLKIVAALQRQNEVVAMTGDGVNDAPALKKADIGIAMGIAGTDVSKEAAHMILLDDNFASIVKAVRTGRWIYDNIRTFIKYVLSGNSAEIWAIFLAPFMGLPIPLLPIHILWINLITDGLTGLAFATEPPQSGIMRRPPRSMGENIFSGGMGFHILGVGLLMGAITIGVQAFSISRNFAHWQTMVFTQLSFIRLIYGISIRSEHASVFQIGLLSNKPLIAAVLLAGILQMGTVYIPAFNPVFHTQPLSWEELLLVMGVSCSVFFIVEIEKLYHRLRSKG